MLFEDYRTSHVGAQSWAQDYDAKLFAPGSFDAAIWEREQLLLDRIVQQHVPRRESCLDFACGTGISIRLSTRSDYYSLIDLL